MRGPPQASNMGYPQRCSEDPTTSLVFEGVLAHAFEPTRYHRVTYKER